MTNDEKNKILENAWKKICEYTVKNYKGKFPEGFRVRGEHNPYYWIEFVVTDTGEARIYRGAHHSSDPSEIITARDSYNVYDGTHTSAVINEEEIAYRSSTRKNDNRNRTCRNIELIIGQWSRIREQIDNEIRRYNHIINFVPDNRVNYKSEISEIRDRLKTSISNILDDKELSLSNHNIGVLYNDEFGAICESYIDTIRKYDDSFLIKLRNPEQTCIVFSSLYKYIDTDTLVDIYNIIYDIKNGTTS